MEFRGRNTNPNVRLGEHDAHVRAAGQLHCPGPNQGLRTDKTGSQQPAYTGNRTYSLVAVVTDNKTGTLNHRPNVTAQIVFQTISTPGGSIPSSSNPWINYGIPLGLAAAIVIAAVAVFLRRRKERKQDEMEDRTAGGPPPGQPPPPPPP